MTLPEMILFDYGQTLASEKFDGLAGTEAVLRYAVKNKHGLSAEQVQKRAEEINRELGRFEPGKKRLPMIEVPNSMFTPYLYESLGIELGLEGAEFDTVFWDAAAPAVSTEGIEDFLEYLKKNGIRTGVISNIAYALEAVIGRIKRLLPGSDFEFIITSSHYIFRKPEKRLFDLALEKAGLAPEKVWYVGDQYESDVKGAAGAGITPVWYTGAVELRPEESSGVLTVSSWKELTRYMESLKA